MISERNGSLAPHRLSRKIKQHSYETFSDLKQINMHGFLMLQHQLKLNYRLGKKEQIQQHIGQRSIQRYLQSSLQIGLFAF